jgi:hypothetical protein
MANEKLANTYTLYLLASARQSALNSCLTGQIDTAGKAVDPPAPPTSNEEAVQSLGDYSQNILGIDLSGREGDLANFFDAQGNTLDGWAEAIPGLLDYPDATPCPQSGNETKIANAIRSAF